jgi:hypothetical protein
VPLVRGDPLRATKCQVDAQPAEQRVLAILERGDAVIVEARLAAPHDDITVPHRNGACAAVSPSVLTMSPTNGKAKLRSIPAPKRDRHRRARRSRRWQQTAQASAAVGLLEATRDPATNRK